MIEATIVYTLVTQPIGAATVAHDDYLRGAERFAKALEKHAPELAPHLLIVGCGGPVSDEQLDAFYMYYAVDAVTYTGEGKDNGAFIYAAQFVKTDWMVCCSSHVHWNKNEALDKLLCAGFVYNDGLFGASASYEISPHIRTPCYAVRREHLLSYPKKLTVFSDANDFECGPNSFTKYMESMSKPTMLVTWDGVYPKSEWRKPANVFRRGDQSNCLVFDRHTEIYERSGPLARAKLEAAADGK